MVDMFEAVTTTKRVLPSMDCNDGMIFSPCISPQISSGVGCLLRFLRSGLESSVPGLLRLNPSILCAVLLSVSAIAVLQNASQSHTHLTGVLVSDLGVAILLSFFQSHRKLHSVDALIGTHGRLKSEGDLTRVIDTIPAFIWCANADGSLAFLNRQMAEFAGITTDGSSHAPSTHWKQLLHPEDCEAADSAWVNALKTGKPYNSIHRIRRADGAYRWFQSVGQPVRDGKGVIAGWYGINLDIEDARRNQERLLEAQEKLSRAIQLATVAELSASIAHEINQPLAAIMANSQACQHWISANPPNLRRLSLSVERIVRDCRATSDIISRVRALFKQAPERVSFDINETIREVLRLVREPTRQNNIKVETSLTQNLPLVLADRVQLQQLLLNVVGNAIDAMSGDAALPRTLNVCSSLIGGSTIEVNIRDFGCGVVDKGRIFESFYTTKEKGLGMGLAICRSIAEQHGGSLDAKPNSDKGTTFTFTLPAWNVLPLDAASREQKWKATGTSVKSTVGILGAA